MKELRLLRGLPGSGKSSLSRKMESEEGAVVFSNDALLTVDGIYKWDEDSALMAHHINQFLVTKKMREGCPLIVIDNTNLLPYHASPYVRLGKFYGYQHKIIQTNTPWCNDLDELEKKNVHSVPRSVLEAMKDVLDNLSAEALDCVLANEIIMDPEVSLRSAQVFIEENKFIKADEQMYDYDDWRYVSGYEPVAGDITADSIKSKLQRWRLLVE